MKYSKIRDIYSFLQTRIETTYSTRPTYLPKTSSVRAMPSTWKPLCFRLTAAMRGEWLRVCVFVSSVPFGFRSLPVVPNFLVSRKISGFRKTILPYFNKEDRGDGVSVTDQCRGVPMFCISTRHIRIGQT